jgi:hypothetical protein
MSKPNDKFKNLKNRAQPTPEKLTSFFFNVKIGIKGSSKKEELDNIDDNPQLGLFIGR